MEERGRPRSGTGCGRLAPSRLGFDGHRRLTAKPLGTEHCRGFFIASTRISMSRGDRLKAGPLCVL